MSFITSLNPQSVAWQPQENNCSNNDSESSRGSPGHAAQSGSNTGSSATSFTSSLEGNAALDLLSHALRCDPEKGGGEDHVGHSAGQSLCNTAAVPISRAEPHSTYAQGHYNHVPFSPPGAGAGLPISHSFQSASAFLSPGASGRPGCNSSGNEFMPSPEHCRGGTFTEPRNYAPRTSGLPVSVTSEPPPKFDLSVATGVRGSDVGAATGNGNGLSLPESNSSTLPIVSQSAGNAAVVPFIAPNYELSPDPVRQSRSEQLNRLTATGVGLPVLQTALAPDNFPFIEGARQAVATNYGVVKLKNIPFATRRSEVIAFLGRNSKILNDSDEPVHIIMERVTSKTMDAYVEFVSLDDANKAVEKHHNHLVNGRVSRLGDRPVEVELSSQESLMKDLFPLAKGIAWNGVSPQFKPFNAKEPWENFKGFVSEEEMIMLVKHVEVPHRSPFSKDCPQRPYECLISTLKKFPWYVTDRITISQRQAIFKATCELARLLSRSIHKQDDPVNLTTQLYRRLVTTAMKCPGFTPLMKDDIACLAGLSEMDERRYNQPRFANSWRHQYSIAPKPGMPLDVLEWYIAVIREQTERDMLTRHHANRTVLQEKSQETDMYWGYFWAELGYMFGPAFDQMTLSQAAQAEFTAVERILARALASQ
ncbi:RNA recognition, RNP-1 [Pochonia chlamydosporia 170]|uniref:RNA recognition, RNP-1 n=1 Tax=Pochonia chlamydosporia 170 TaxID=1380566 RepID=A0A179F5C9_METCM|nr:RNA recognition, RNP-1 [Pochonia chlamydosporia 170]OAQ60636.1 RNA recognition, RNP-1 [Pochonia chlamydosporia 170]